MATPMFRNSLLKGEETDVDKMIEKDLTSPRLETTTATSSSPPGQSVILRVWHNEDVYTSLEEKDLNQPRAIGSFKSVKATSATPAKVVVDTIGKKLLVSDVSLFRLFLVDTKAFTMRLLREDEKPVSLLNVAPDKYKIAFIHAPNVGKQKLKKAERELRWAPADGDLSHRWLLNDSVYQKLSDFTMVIDKQEIHTFQAILEIRAPELMQNTSLVKKKKERKLAHAVGWLIELNDNSVSYPIMQQVLDWVYTGKLDFVHLQLTELMKIMQAAQQIPIPALENLVGSHLRNDLGMHNVFPFLKASHQLEIQDLKEFCIDFCLRNWQTVSGNKEGLSVVGLELFQELTVANAAGRVPDEFVPEPTPPNTVASDFRKIHKLMHFADAVAQFPDGTVPFHRHIVAAASDRLRELCLKESVKKMAQMQIPDLSADSFRGLLELIYFGDTTMSHVAACHLLEHAVTKYNMPHVGIRCEKIITAGFDHTNVLEVLKITYLPEYVNELGFTVIRHNALLYIRENFSAVNIPHLRVLSAQIGSTCAFDVLEVLHGSDPLANGGNTASAGAGAGAVLSPRGSAESNRDKSKARSLRFAD